MVVKNSISQQTLTSKKEFNSKGRRLPQYIAAIAATLGAASLGTVSGWATSAGTSGVNLVSEYGIPISSTEFSWIGSMPNLGGAAICIPIGLLMDVVGRKRGMLMMVVPFTVGWGLVIWSRSVLMFYIGRFLLGLGGGAFGVAAPIYTAEIAEKEIRGTLGSYYQLSYCIGILLSYIVGAYASLFVLSLVSAAVPLLFFGLFSFMPETPVYHLMKNREYEARASLLRLRGPRYDVEQELQAKKEALAEEQRNRGSILEALKGKVALKGLIIAIGLMAFQQLSGVKAIIYYIGSLFGESGNLSPEASSITAGGMQIGAVFVSTLVVDKLGRKILLISSQIAVAICAVVLGVYYYLDHIEADVSAVSWLPLVCVSLYLITANLGSGPISWLMIGELFSPQVKGIAGSSACVFNWIAAFVVTKFYSDLVNTFGNYTTFWIFGGVSVLGTFFVIFFVPETKGKSLEQIQMELGAETGPVIKAEKA